MAGKWDTPRYAKVVKINKGQVHVKCPICFKTHFHDFHSRQDLLEAEKEAIQREHPRFNVIFNGDRDMVIP